MEPSTDQDDQIIEITPTRAEVIDPKRERLAVLAEDTRTRMKRSALDIYHIGANLLEAQNLLAHGEFLPWIKAEFDMSQRSAYKFMNVAKAFQGKFAQNANLEIAASALYLLASPETPDDARNEALELAAAGEPISPKKARKIIEKHTSVAKEIEALGESLGLPTQEDSVLPQSDRIDDLTHTSPADVDDRPGAPPTQLQPVSHNYNTGFSMTTENMFAPTPAQWQAAQAKHAELLQALKDAQTELEQLTAENLNLHEANSDLHQEIALLLTELAALKVPLQPQADA